ncbi:MAG: hypothetical protein IJK81_06970 [Selenomonadaceae bacterium]|nr:hypothetical protein [Selenomonadaceae bacterium]
MTTEDRVNSLERQVATTMAKVDMIIGELRDRDNQRAQEISQLRQKHDADIHELNKKIDDKFDKLSAQIQNLTIAAIVGIGAIVLGGGAIVWSAITTLK